MPGPQRVSVLRRKGQVFSGSCLCLSPAEDQAEELRPGLATVEPWVSPFLSESRFPSGCPGMRLGHLAEGQQLVEVWKAVVGSPALSPAGWRTPRSHFGPPLTWGS